MNAKCAQRFGGLAPGMIALDDPASDAETDILDAARPLGCGARLELLRNTAVLDRLIELNGGSRKAIAWPGEQDEKRSSPVIMPPMEQSAQRQGPHVTPPLPEHSGDLHSTVLIRRLENLYYSKPKPSLETDPWGRPRNPGGGGFRYPTW